MNKGLVAVFLGASLLVAACGTSPTSLTLEEQQILAKAKVEQAASAGVERITLSPIVGSLEAGHYRVKADIGGVTHKCNLSVSASITAYGYVARNETLSDCTPIPVP